MSWTRHPSGIRSRPLLDDWPAIDPLQGFEPPFTVDTLDPWDAETIGVFPTLAQASRRASRASREAWGRRRIEITDARNRTL